MENKPSDPVHACRSQYIKALSLKSCSYFTADHFSGEHMSGMLEQFAVGIERGFNRCAIELKDYAEKCYQQSCAQ